jgi:spermidine synthase
MFFRLFKVLDEVRSPLNGNIQVVKDVNGTRLVVDGISQSGWSMKAIWDRAIKRIKIQYPSPKSVLILGLGGGSAAQSVQRHWKQSKIIGIDVDPFIVDLGKKYLGLSKVDNIKVTIADANQWVKEKAKEIRALGEGKSLKSRKSFDVILVDLFVGESIPQVFKEEKFLKNLIQLVNPYGLIAINHLYGVNDKEDAKKLAKNLRKSFAKVVTFYPSSNVIFFCYPKSRMATKTTSLR